MFLLDLVSQNVGIAQLFFLIAVIVAAVAVFIGYIERAAPIYLWPLVYLILLFMALGLLLSS